MSIALAEMMCDGIFLALSHVKFQFFGFCLYLKQDVEKVALFMDIFNNDGLKHVASISDIGHHHHMTHVPNSKYDVIKSAIYI